VYLAELKLKATKFCKGSDGKLHLFAHLQTTYMNWYLTKIVYRIICGEGNHLSQFDEQLRLIEAEDDFHAFIKARQLGHREEDNFLNKELKPVNWKFIDVKEVQLLSTMEDGVELNSCISEKEDANGFIRDTYLRAAQLMEKLSSKNAAVN
jgi:hypothetical protein